MRCVSAVAVLLWSVGAAAHHSHAEFSSELDVVEGELLSIAWRNPHPSMTLSVASGDVEETWQVQVLGNINGLRRDGVTGDMFTLGERIRITGQPSRRRPGLLLATHVVFSDGGDALPDRRSLAYESRTRDSTPMKNLKGYFASGSSPSGFEIQIFLSDQKPAPRRPRGMS